MFIDLNTYFQYLSSRFTSKDIKRMCKHGGQMNRAQKNKQSEITNGDMIRSMSDVELANFLATDAVIACTHCKGDLCICHKGEHCEHAHEASVFCDWLGKRWQPGRWTYEQG